MLRCIERHAKKKSKNNWRDILSASSITLSSWGQDIQMTRLLLGNSNFKSWTTEQRWSKYAKIQAKLLAVTNRQPVKGFNSAKHFMEPASRKSTVYCRWRVAWELGSDLRCKNMAIVTILHSDLELISKLGLLVSEVSKFVLFLTELPKLPKVFTIYSFVLNTFRLQN